MLNLVGQMSTIVIFNMVHGVTNKISKLINTIAMHCTSHSLSVFKSQQMRMHENVRLKSFDKTPSMVAKICSHTVIIFCFCLWLPRVMHKLHRQLHCGQPVTWRQTGLWSFYRVSEKMFLKEWTRVFSFFKVTSQLITAQA